MRYTAAAASCLQVVVKGFIYIGERSFFIAVIDRSLPLGKQNNKEGGDAYGKLGLVTPCYFPNLKSFLW